MCVCVSSRPETDDVQRKPLCAVVLPCARRGLNFMQPIITKVWRLLMGYWSCLLSSALIPAPPPSSPPTHPHHTPAAPPPRRRYRSVETPARLRRCVGEINIFISFSPSSSFLATVHAFYRYYHCYLYVFGGKVENSFCPNKFIDTAMRLKYYNVFTAFEGRDFHLIRFSEIPGDFSHTSLSIRRASRAVFVVRLLFLWYALF